MWTRAATWTEAGALALVILALAAFLRCAALDQTVARHVDEGLHLYEAKRMLGVARALRQTVHYWRTNPPTTVPRLDLTPAQRADVEALANEGPDLQYARPLWNATIAATARAAGFTPWVGNLTSAWCGVLGVLALGLLARRWCGTGAALVAMAFLACSPTHLWYSRTTFADVAGLAWLCAALALFDARRPCLAGLFYGAALATNPRCLHMAILFLAPVAAHWDSFQDSLRRAGRFALATLAVPLACEAAYHAVLCAGAAAGVHLVRKTYLMSFAQLLVANTKILVGGQGHGQLATLQAGAENPAVVALALAGLALALTRRPGFQPAAAAAVLATLVPLHLLTHPELRYALVAVPFLCLVAGATAWHLAGALPAPLRAPALAVLAGTVPGLVTPPGAEWLSPRTGRGEPTTWSRSPWPALRADLGLAEGRLAASAHPTLWAADVPWSRLPLYENSLAELARSGARAYVVEATEHTTRHPPRTEMVERLRERGGARVFDDPLGGATRTWADGPSAVAGPARRAQGRVIEVYPVDGR